MNAVQPALFGAPQTQATSDDYYTPAWVFEAMGITFDLDVAAPPGGVPWVPADRYLTVADDGLAHAWRGRVWCNPPYSNATPWVDRFIAHGNGACLLPWAKSSWLGRIWAAADGLTLPPRFDFTKWGTARFGGQISSPVFFAAFGDECVEAISRLGVVRVARGGAA